MEAIHSYSQTTSEICQQEVKANCEISLLRVMLVVVKKVFRPLERIISTFPNPANDKYGWFGTERTEFIFLNDLGGLVISLSEKTNCY